MSLRPCTRDARAKISQRTCAYSRLPHASSLSLPSSVYRLSMLTTGPSLYMCCVYVYSGINSYTLFLPVSYNSRRQVAEGKRGNKRLCVVFGPATIHLRPSIHSYCKGNNKVRCCLPRKLRWALIKVGATEASCFTFYFLVFPFFTFVLCNWAENHISVDTFVFVFFRKVTCLFDRPIVVHEWPQLFEVYDNFCQNIFCELTRWPSLTIENLRFLELAIFDSQTFDKNAAIRKFLFKFLPSNVLEA